MCGIAGYCRPPDSTGPTPNLKRMTRLLSHRGPDGEEYYEAPGVGLGHRRLSIIDLTETGRQPMANEDGSVRVTYNGEIYNFGELRGELEKRGHIFASRSDTEVLVHGYEEWGENLPLRLRGMFAFAIRDEKKKLLFLARDHFGIKPLYYSFTGNDFVFASEIKSILSHKDTKEPDFAALDQYLSFLYVPEPRTIYKSIKALPPAHSLTFADNRISIRRYWSFDSIRTKPVSEAEAIADIREVLEDSVRAMLVADVPVGVFLSGGLDSSGILALASKHAKEPVQTFSVGFDEQAKNWDELRAAKKIADHFGAKHREFRVDPDAVGLLPRIVRGFDQPFANPTAIILSLLSEQTSRYVKVVLSGTGGDEMFAGYPRYLGMRLFQLYGILPSVARCFAADLGGKFIKDATDGRQWMNRIRRFFKAGTEPFEDCYIDFMTVFDQTRKQNLYSDEFSELLRNNDTMGFIRPFLANRNSGNAMETLMNTDVNTYLPFNQLAYADRMSMAHSLEIRVPFIDQKLVALAGGIPLGRKLTGFVTKGLFRKAVSPLLPSDIVNAPKQGLNLPIAIWFRNDLRDWICRLLSPDCLKKRNYFKPEAVSAVLDEHLNGGRDYSLFLWALAVLEIWHREYID